MARFAFSKCDHAAWRAISFGKIILGLLLLCVFEAAVSPIFANGLRIDEDGNQNVNVTIEESLVPKASIKRTDSQMIIQVPEHSGFDPAKLQMNPALKGKVDVVQTGGEKGVPKKTVVTIHSGNIYLNVDNQQNSPSVPAVHHASPHSASPHSAGHPSSDVGVSIPRSTKMAKPPGVPALRTLQHGATRPPHLPRISDLKPVGPKKTAKGFGLPNPFDNPLVKNPLALLQPKPQAKSKPEPNKLATSQADLSQYKPGQTNLSHNQPLPPSVVREKQALFKPLSSTAVVSKPAILGSNPLPHSLQKNSPQNLSIPEKVSEPEQNPLQEDVPVAVAASADSPLEPERERVPETEGEAGIPLSQILPNQKKEGAVSSDVFWRTIASTFLVLVMVVASIKLGLPKLVSRYPEWFNRFQENAKNRQRNLKSETPSYRPKGRLKSTRLNSNKKTPPAPSYAAYATPKPQSQNKYKQADSAESPALESQTAFDARFNRRRQGQETSFKIPDLPTENTSPKPDWKSRIFNRPPQKMGSAAPVSKPSGGNKPDSNILSPKALPAVQTSRPEHLETFAKEGMTLVNHLPLSGNRDLYWVTMAQDNQTRNLVIAATGDQMSLVTHFRDGEAPEIALPKSVYDLLGTTEGQHGEPNKGQNLEPEPQQITLPFAQLGHQPAPSLTTQPSKDNALAEQGTRAYVESSQQPEELAPDPALAERYARRKSFKRLSQWMAGNEDSLEFEEEADASVSPGGSQAGRSGLQQSPISTQSTGLTPKEALKQFATPPSEAQVHSNSQAQAQAQKQNQAAVPSSTDIIEAEEVMVLEDYDDVYHPY